MDKASEALFGLKPVTFRYRKNIDPTQMLAFGLIAEEVEKVNPDLVARNADGQPESVRYEYVNAMLLNEFLKEHRKVEEQDHKMQEQEARIAQLKSTVTKQEAAIAQQRKNFEATIAGLKKEMETVAARFKEQDARIQEVSDQIEFSKPVARMALNSP
jgi:septal ring factor EnvC (AmiA/AmiB activator)